MLYRFVIVVVFCLFFFTSFGEGYKYPVNQIIGCNSN